MADYGHTNAIQCVQSVFAPVPPDPRRPAYPHLHSAGPMPIGGSGKRWERYQRQRADILACSRRMLSDVGFERVCVREIARSCSVSVPTVYNVVGDRASILREGSAEWTRWLAAATNTRSPNESRTLAVLESFWTSALIFPDYVASAARICALPESPLVQTFVVTARTIFRDLLVDLKRSGDLRPWIDADSLAGQLTQSIQVGVGSWVFSKMGLSQFRRGFAYGPGLMLLAAADGSEVARIEAALERIISIGDGPK